MTGPAVEHVVGPLGEIPVGEGRSYAVDGREVAVFRLRGGAVRATQARCPHAGGPLADGQVDDCLVMCPLHGHSYELETGAARSGPTPIEVYPVRVDGGVVLVSLPR